MNAIVTVIGKDKVGIIATVCIKLAELNVNVLDISQTILNNKFTMVMAVDAGAANVSFDRLLAMIWSCLSGFSGKKFLTPCTEFKEGRSCSIKRKFSPPLP